SVAIEVVFAWPGIGRLMFEAINQRDYAVILGVFYISGAMVLLFNLITDVVYVIVDPRIKLTR
ncbi:MAG TPA: ABC transporter permease subunit, partial [Paracoccus sp.]|nr:ABC transporter permease subunit [Paracoccus sp. (in: a-proteobacteria)]